MRTGRKNRPGMILADFSRVGTTRRTTSQPEFNNRKRSMSTPICEVSKNTPLACLFAENPHRLVSLWEIMKRFEAGECCRLFSVIAHYEQLAAAKPQRDYVPPDIMEQIDSVIDGAVIICT